MACALVLAGILAGGCSAAGDSGIAVEAGADASARLEPAANPSGLLSDYSMLRPSDQYASVLLYRDDKGLRGYRRLYFRPVEVWRGSSEQLQDIPEQDLQYLADSFYKAVVSAVGKHFELAPSPGPGVLEIDLGLTLVADENQPVDMFSTAVPVPDLPARNAPLQEATRRFIRDCALEAEFAESSAPVLQTRAPPARARSIASPPRPVAMKRTVRAAFFDARRGAETPKGTVETWADVDAVFARWAGFLDDQLVALREGTFQPKLTVQDGKPQPPR